MNAQSPIPGERSVASVGQMTSRAVRLQRRLAMIAVGALGAGALIWYYVHLTTSSHAAAAQRHADSKAATATEMRLPALDSPRRAPVVTAGAPAAAGADSGAAGGPPHDQSATETGAARPAPHGHESARSLAARGTSGAGSSVVLRADEAPAGAPGSNRASADPRLDELRRLVVGQERDVAPPRSSALSEALVPTVAAAAEATIVPTRRWLLPKGSFLDCTLETAIDSTLPGLATCLLAVDAFGADGRIVLLERGTKLIGEARSDVHTGQARVAVLWSEARTPTGVVVGLASPATDALGRAGVPGAVDNHFAARFGSAVLLSVIDGAISGFVAREQGSAGVVYNPQSSRDVATEALRGTIAIPPTINVPAGARVQVIVARDIDFRRVYSVVPSAGR